MINNSADAANSPENNAVESQATPPSGSKRMDPVWRERLKGFFTKNLALKITSLLFAMVLWGYVMMDQNPQRTKIIPNIDVSVEGEADMLSRNLIIRGDRETMFSDITANAVTQITNYADLGAADIRASVSVRSIMSPGEYDLGISATCVNGTVDSTTPATVHVEVDSLVTKRIPVEYTIVAGAPDGYWAGMPTLSRTEIEIQGPETDIRTVVKGICYINLSQRTASYNESLPITLLDARGRVVSDSILYRQIASVSVQQTIMHMKSLNVDVTDALLGVSNLASNFEIAEVRVTPTTVDVAGTLDALETLESISVDSIDLSGRSESLLLSAPLIVPEGVTLLTEQTAVSVYIDIREKQAQANFEQIPIKTIGQERKTTVTMSAESADIELTGRTTLISRLDRADLYLYVDVTGLTPGTYTLPLQLELPSETMQDELNWSLSLDTINVTITQK